MNHKIFGAIIPTGDENFMENSIWLKKNKK